MKHDSQDRWWMSRYCVLPFLGIGAMVTMAVLSGLVLSSPYWASNHDFNIGLILTCNSTSCVNTWNYLKFSDFVMEVTAIEATGITFNTLASLTGLFYVCKRPDITGWLTFTIILGFMGGVFSLISAWHFAVKLPPAYTKEWAWYVAIGIGIFGLFQVGPLVILRVTLSKTLGQVKTNLGKVKPNLVTVKPNLSTVRPAQGKVKPNFGNVKPNQSTVKPNQSTVKPNQSTVKPILSNMEPNPSSVKPNGDQEKNSIAVRSVQVDISDEITDSGTHSVRKQSKTSTTRAPWRLGAQRNVSL